MRFLVGFVISIGLIILAFVLILHSFRPSSPPSSLPSLINYANSDTTVEMTIDGPINADQEHYQLQMTVGQTLSILNLDKGYEGVVVTSDNYNNNSNSYAEFLRSLDLAGYRKGNSSSTANSDPRGYCPLGERYSFQIISGGRTVQNYWATTCGGQGTFQGNVNLVKTLFMAQMPDFDTVISNTDLY